MKAIQEIGYRKTLRFLAYCLLQVIYHNVIDHFLFFPQCRKFFLQMLGAKVGSDTFLMNINFFNWHHRGPAGLVIGDKCFVGDNTLLDLHDKITLEDEVTIAQNVTVLTHTNVGYGDHPLQKYFPKISKQVVLKTGSVIGAGALILPGVTIGKLSFIAAGSVVTKDVPKRSLAAGVPARVIRKLE